MRAVVLAAAVVFMSLLGDTQATSRMDRHDAKVAAFKALLTLTERAPDSADATHAAITVGSCVHTSFGFRCVGELAPVMFSGIEDTTCHYVISVFAHRTRIAGTDC